MALMLDYGDLVLLDQALGAALELLRLHKASEELFTLDGFSEYGGNEVEARLFDLRVRVHEAIEA